MARTRPLSIPLGAASDAHFSVRMLRKYSIVRCDPKAINDGQEFIALSE
jgi:hypothetical protein